MPRKFGKDTPHVLRGILYSEDEFNGTEVNSRRWTEFLEGCRTFYFDADGAVKSTSFTARCEERRKGFFWYAYCSFEGKKTFKAYIGRTELLGSERLENASHRLYELIEEYIREAL